MPLDEANVEDMERRAAAEQMDLRREKHDESADREERANMETAFVKGRCAFVADMFPSSSVRRHNLLYLPFVRSSAKMKNLDSSSPN